MSLAVRVRRMAELLVDEKVARHVMNRAATRPGDGPVWLLVCLGKMAAIDVESPAFRDVVDRAFPDFCRRIPDDPPSDHQLCFKETRRALFDALSAVADELEDREMGVFA